MRRAVTVVATLAVPVAVVLALAFGLAGCGDDGDGAPAPTVTTTVTETAAPTPTAVDTGDPSAITTVSLYFLRGETLGVAHRAVPATSAPATAAMDALLGGPDKREKAAGLGTAVPEGTTLNGVTIEDGTARVDLSGAFASGGGTLSMQARVAQVVYTLTQFRTVRDVVFMVDHEVVYAIGGEGVVVDGPQRRADWAGFLPAIFVETPAVGDTVRSPVTLAGTAMVFEATFVAEVLDEDGEILTQQTVMASRGAPQRGRFSVEFGFPTHGSRRGALLVYEVSMEDGSRMNQVRIPLRFAGEE
jgi:hypothetical protein